MPNTLFRDQQDKNVLIPLLAAQKQLYIEGKQANNRIFWLTFLTSILFPLFIAFLPTSILPIAKPYIGIIGGIISLFIFFVYKGKSNQKAQQAARVQEEFDTRLFNLPQNTSLTGGYLSDNEVARAYEALPKVEAHDNVLKKPWYQNYSNLDHSYAVLKCQMENLWWDSTQRKKFSNYLGWVAVILLVLGFVINFFVLGLDHWSYLLRFFFPMAGFILFVYSIHKKHGKVADQLEGTMEGAQNLYNKYEQRGQPIPTEDLRALQDKIFKSRRDGELVPEQIYEWIKKDGELEKILRRKAMRNNKIT